MKDRGVPALFLLLVAVLAHGCQMGMALGLIPPEQPKGLAVSASASGLHVSWIRSTGATGYQAFRDTSPAGLFSTLAYSGPDSSFTDTGLEAGTTWWYRVRAWSAAGTGESTPAVPAVTQAAPAPESAR